MTSKQKIKILSDIREALITGTHAGFCSAYCEKVNCELAEPKLLELGLKKPKKTLPDPSGFYTGNAFWYKPYYHKTRIRKIDELIKRLSK